MLAPRLAALALVFVAIASPVCAQGTEADYTRAEYLRTKYYGLVEGIADEPTFTADSKTLVYRRTLNGGGYQFMQIDIPTLVSSVAFDQTALARTLASLTQRPYGGGSLPFANYTLSQDRANIEFEAASARWRCKLADYSCEKLE